MDLMVDNKMDLIVNVPWENLRWDISNSKPMVLDSILDQVDILEDTSTLEEDSMGLGSTLVCKVELLCNMVVVDCNKEQDSSWSMKLYLVGSICYESVEQSLLEEDSKDQDNMVEIVRRVGKVELEDSS
jgi:hypothetical protein